MWSVYYRRHVHPEDEEAVHRHPDAAQHRKAECRHCRGELKSTLSICCTFSSLHTEHPFARDTPILRLQQPGPLSWLDWGLQVHSIMTRNIQEVLEHGERLDSALLSLYRFATCCCASRPSNPVPSY